MDSPEKLSDRKEEITHDFLRLVDNHIDDLLHRKTEKRLIASDFADMLFIAPRHLTNTLKLTIGKSPCDVMEEKVVIEASKLLLETALPVAEISFIFGYGDTTNFIKFFKGMAGVTPLQYRKNAHP